MTPQNPLLEFNEELRWYGQKTLICTGLHLGNVVTVLPRFRREPFGENEYLDMIVRQPDQAKPRPIPVASVSKRYALIQHIELAGWISKGLKEVGVAAESIPVDLWMSEYGERLRVRFVIQKQSFDPGDGHQVVLAAECFNSVDKSCALEMRILWLRLVCRNGLAVEERSRIRKIHDLAWMSRDDPAEFLREKLEAAPGQFGLVKNWINQKVSMEAIAEWVDDVIAEEWNVGAAARVYHIANCGWDGVVQPGSAGRPAHIRTVSSDREVPGACAPVGNLYHASQVLSWIAGTRSTIEEQDDWTRKIPGLIERLRALELSGAS